MAEFNYFATHDESVTMLRDLLSRGDVRAYVDTGPHEGPDPPPPFSTFTAEMEVLLQRGDRVFLFGPFSTHAPLLRRQEGGEHHGKYFQGQKGGGPLITFDLGGLTTKGSTLLPGGLSTQPIYQLTPGHWEKPGPALKAAYQDLVKRMKKHLVRYQGEWIGPEALRLLQSGQVQLPAGVGRSKPAASSSSSPPGAPLPRAADSSR